MENLIEKLKNEDIDTNQLGILSEIGEKLTNGGKISKELELEILQLFESENDFVRIKCTEISEFSKADEIIDKLIERLKNDSNYFVRGFSAKALGAIGNLRVKDSLEEALDDKEGFVVSFAMQALKNINLKSAFSSKLNMLKSKLKAGSKNG
ncbi:HEAT repeat domain-containing protein [Haliovirga abyssi]|uniref:HEAT repeat domain-containing protein n=1 Tax=Haliovirga abyssi TaxID=2996794 RepID=A0AAU9D4L0_9FUSO|nr:HEAT repeat domain-containing protein [Haliovirga abyssi]BDU50966.1 hypothetical protein HLVA_15350 [Haliovirga abyssi]